MTIATYRVLSFPFLTPYLPPPDSTSPPVNLRLALLFKCQGSLEIRLLEIQVEVRPTTNEGEEC